MGMWGGGGGGGRRKKERERDLTKSVIIVELTVCYETNYKEAQARKETKYTELVEEIEQMDL